MVGEEEEGKLIEDPTVEGTIDEQDTRIIALDRLEGAESFTGWCIATCDCFLRPKGGQGSHGWHALGMDSATLSDLPQTVYISVSLYESTSPCL